MMHRRSCFINSDAPKYHEVYKTYQTKKFDSFLNWKAPNNHPMASTMPKQTYRQTTSIYVVLPVLHHQLQYSPINICLTTHKINQIISVSEVNSFKINLLQYPKNLNASTNSSPNLRHILDHCCLCQKKFGEMFCFAFQHYILSNNQSQYSKIVKFLHQWQWAWQWKFWPKPKNMVGSGWMKLKPTALRTTGWKITGRKIMILASAGGFVDVAKLFFMILSFY